MDFSIQPFEDSDFRAAVDVMFDAMGGGSPFINACYPHNMESAARSKYASLFLSLKARDPSQRWIKVCENATGQIVGVGQFLVYDQVQPAATEIRLGRPEGYYDNETEKEFADALLVSRMERRQVVLREVKGPLMVWGIMTVAPNHQYRGVGTLMAQWGAAMADAIGAESVLESSVAARWLYEKHGFVVQSHYSLTVPKSFESRPKERLFLMRRSATDLLREKMGSLKAHRECLAEVENSY